MSTNHSAGRCVAKPKKDRSTNLCAFAFADGRQCRTPRCSGHLHFCYFHAQKEAETVAAKQVGEDISRFLPTKLLTACDLGVAMSRLFCAVARGEVKPKVASTLAYLAQTMLQSIPIAQHEYIESFNTNTWRNAVRVSFRYDDPPSTPAPEPAPKPPASPSAPPTPVAAGLVYPEPRREPGSSASSNSSPTPQPSAQPAPSPHTPLPPTITEFAQQLLAGRNSSRSETPASPVSETPTLPGSGREPNSSGPSSPAPSSASYSPASAPAPASSTQPVPPSPGTGPTPPAPQSTSPQQSQPTQNSQHNSQPTAAQPAPPPVPPGFGAPANWDVLIPPKPRRRLSRHWLE
jgi:hypothetical protein